MTSETIDQCNYDLPHPKHTTDFGDVKFTCPGIDKDDDTFGTEPQERKGTDGTVNA